MPLRDRFAQLHATVFRSSRQPSEDAEAYLRRFSHHDGPVSNRVADEVVRTLVEFFVELDRERNPARPAAGSRER
jgi:hypothetical protein